MPQGSLKGQAHVDQAVTNIIDGKGLSEADELLNEFARKADMALRDARTFVTEGCEGFSASLRKKARVFNEAVSAEYGDLDAFRAAYEAEPGAITSPKVA